MSPYIPEVRSSAESHVVWRSREEAKKITLIDRAKKGYARGLEMQYGVVPSKTSACVLLEEENDKVSEKGWALAQEKSKSKFSDRQKAYLTKKFEEGEKSGKTLKADQVAQDMRRVRDEIGMRVFTIEEFLTSKQVASFFSRLAAKNAVSQLLITRPLKLKKFERRRTG